MEADSLPLPESEWSGLLPDRIRHAHAAQVVCQRGVAQAGHGSRRQPDPPGGGLRQLGHPGGVAAKPRRLEAGERRDGHEGGIHPFACHPDLRKRLDLQRLLPDSRLVQLGEQVDEVSAREISEPRVVGLTRSTFDHGASLVRARGGEEERHVPGHVQETHGQRDLVATDVRESPPVPACEDVLERGLDAGAELEPPREPLRHLAHRRERLARPGPGVGDGLLDQLRAHLRAAPDPNVRPVEREDLRGLGGINEVEGGPVRDVVAVELRRLVPVGGAP